MKRHIYSVAWLHVPVEHLRRCSCGLLAEVPTLHEYRDLAPDMPDIYYQIPDDAGRVYFI